MLDQFLALIGWLLLGYGLLRLFLICTVLFVPFVRILNPFRGLSAVAKIYPFACPYCHLFAVGWDIHRHQAWVRPDGTLSLACSCRNCGVRFTVGRVPNGTGFTYPLLGRYD